jgi:hypothetical protein
MSTSSQEAELVFKNSNIIFQGQASKTKALFNYTVICITCNKCQMSTQLTTGLIMYSSEAVYSYTTELQEKIGRFETLPSEQGSFLQ